MGEIKSFAKMALDTYLKPSLDQSNPLSFETARNDCALTAIQKKNELDGYLGRWWWLSRNEVIGRGHDPDHNPVSRVYNIFGIASGGLDAPLTFTSSGRLNVEVPWYPRIGGREDGDGGYKRFETDLAGQRQAVLDLLTREAMIRSHIETIRKVIELLEGYVGSE